MSPNPYEIQQTKINKIETEEDGEEETTGKGGNRNTEEIGKANGKYIRFQNRVRAAAINPGEHILTQFR